MTREIMFIRRTRKGAALIIALVLIAVIGTISAILLKNLLEDRLQQRRVEIRAQSKILLADWVKRTETKLRENADFPGEQTAITPFTHRWSGTYYLTSRKENEQMIAALECRDEEGRIFYTEEQTVLPQQNNENPE